MYIHNSLYRPHESTGNLCYNHNQTKHITMNKLCGAYSFQQLSKPITAWPWSTTYEAPLIRNRTTFKCWIAFRSIPNMLPHDTLYPVYGYLWLFITSHFLNMSETGLFIYNAATMHTSDHKKVLYHITFMMTIAYCSGLLDPKTLWTRPSSGIWRCPWRLTFWHSPRYYRRFISYTSRSRWR